MKIGFASSNPSFSRPILQELSTRGHEIVMYQHSGDPQQNAFQVGKLRGLCERVFVDFAQEPLLSIVHDSDVPVTVRMHRVEMYSSDNYVIEVNGQQQPFPWDKVSHLVFVCEHVKQRFIATCNQRGIPLPRSMPVIEHVGVDTDLFKFVERDWSKPPFVLTIAGNLLPKKRQYTLIEMFADAEKQWPGQFGLKLIGSANLPGYGNSEYPVNCSDVIERLKLENVATSPWVDHKAMPQQYAESAFVVSASNEEGCATTVAEGMATGCIPLVAAWRGARDLYPPMWCWETPRDFERLLMRFLTMSPEDRGAESVAAREWVMSRWEMKGVARRMADLIQGQSKADFYDGMLEHWVQQRDNPRQVAQGEWILSHLTPYTSMLEVGCAIGRQCELAKRMGVPRVVGVDISRAALFHAITSAQQQGLEIEYGLVTEEAQFPPGPYSLAVLFDVLEHVHPQQWRSLLERVAAQLDPGGVLLISFPYEAQVHAGGFQVEEYVVYPKIVRMILRELGFEVAMSPFGEQAEEFRMEAVKR